MLLWFAGRLERYDSIADFVGVVTAAVIYSCGPAVHASLMFPCKLVDKTESLASAYQAVPGIEADSDNVLASHWHH